MNPNQPPAATGPTPDETRRAGIRALPIALADGATWGLAAPMLRYRPEFRMGQGPHGRPTLAVRAVATVGHPAGVDRLRIKLHQALVAGTPEAQDAALRNLAAGLLRVAHDLDAEAAVALVAVGVDRLPDLVAVTLAAATGSVQEPTTSTAGRPNDA